MTAQEVIDYVRGIINSPYEGYLTNAEIIGWINDAVREFYTIEGIESIWYYDAEEGDIEIPFDQRIIKVADLFIVTEDGTKIDVDEADYKIFANTIFLMTPNKYKGKYYVHGFYLPDPITQTTDTIPIPKLFEDAIKKYALAQAYLKDENYALYQQQLSLFYNRVSAYKALNKKVNERKYIDIKKGW